MNLVIDIGNTLVKYAVFNDKKIIKFEKSDDFDTKIIDDLLQKHIIKNIIISSVREK